MDKKVMVYKACGDKIIMPTSMRMRRKQLQT